LTAFIKARVRNASDADDILQDVFFEFVQAYRLPESIEQVSGWLFRVARNRIIDRFRKKKANSFSETAQDQDGERGSVYLDIELPASAEDPEAEFTRSAILAALQQALDELPAYQREIFVAHLSHRDGVPVNTLLSRKRYAVLHLRRRLQVFYDELKL